MESLTPEQVAELQTKATAQEAENRKLQVDLLEAQKTKDGDKTLHEQVAAMKAQSEKLSQENKDMRINNAKADAMKKYPGAAPFLTNITGDTAEEIEAKAKDFHEKAAGIQATVIKEKEEEIRKTWGNIPAGSTPNVFSQTTFEEGYEKANAMPVKNARDLMSKLTAKFKLKLGRLATNMNGK